MDSSREHIAIPRNLKAALWAGGILLALDAFWHLSNVNYLLFHATIEGFSIVISFTIFVVAVNTRRFIQNHYLLFLGLAAPFIGALDFLHTLAFKGMGVFPGGGANLATQLWIQARILQAASILGAGFFLRRKVSVGIVLTVYAAATIVMLLSVFAVNVFPVCYIEPAGLTAFKKVSEYAICAALLAGLAIAVRNRDLIGPKVFAPLAWAIGFMVASEVTFTLYARVTDAFNMAGHLFKIVAFYLIYKALIEVGLRDPYGSMFLSLQQNRKHLLRAQEALSRKNEELEAFVYAAGHDLRTPLTSASGYAQLLKKSLSGSLDPARESMIDMVLSSQNHMFRLLKDLLDFAHLGDRTAPSVPIDTSGLIRDIAEDVRNTVQEKEAEIVAAEALPDLWMSRTKAYQLFMNLISNGLKFSRKDVPPRIEIGVVESEGEADRHEHRVFFVRDNGVGIGEEKRDRIFDLFYTSDEVEGRSTGAGLAIVKRIVEQKGGRIWVESAPGQGSVFYFTLPVGPPRE